MFSPASRSLLRAAVRTPFPRTTPTSRLGPRFLSTAPPAQRSRGWKNAALRWGAAGGIVYWYNTTNLFAEELGVPVPHQAPEAHHDAEALPTIDSLAAQRRQREESLKGKHLEYKDGQMNAGPLGEGGAAPGSPEALEQEADQQGAFNPETGEINWDCPCLGGMAHGPCGENFKEAFSCFVFSEEEPKGVDCIEKFKGMQDCFRQHPDIYGAELEDDEDSYEGEEDDKALPIDSSPDGTYPPTPVAPASPPTASSKPEEPSVPVTTMAISEDVSTKEKAKAATEPVKAELPPQSESDELVPKAWHNAK